MWHLSRGLTRVTKSFTMIIKKAFKRVGWFFEFLSWYVLTSFYRRAISKHAPLGFCIGVTTYKDRFDSCLRPLIAKLCILFPGEQIIVVANGHYLADEQKNYMEKIDAFCREFKNIESESYADPRGLSFLWNRIIKKSFSENILILNDDIRVKAGFRRFIERSGIIETKIATINSSWSHFRISKEVTEKVGLFDEGFTEIGGEDDDYAARNALAGSVISNFTTDSIGGKSENKKERNALNSYGKTMNKENGGYSTLNSEYLGSKWIISDTYFNGSVLVPDRKYKYWKLRSED